MDTERPIVICGMNRTGTSITASVVHAWGAFGGDTEELLSRDEANPRGFWQHRGLSSFLSGLLREVGLGFWDPGFPDAARAKASDPRHRETACALMAQMQSAGRPWFWKNPLLTVWLPFWKELWRDAVYIITVRHPYATALSWQRYWLPAEAHGKVRIAAAALLQWQAMMLLVLESTEGCRSRQFVVYEQLVTHPHEECRRLSEFLSREYDGVPADGARVADMAAHVDPQLMTARVNIPFDEVAVATDAQKALYRLLLAKAADPGLPFDRRLYPLHPGAHEYLDNLQVLSTVYRQLVRMQAADRADAAPAAG